MKRAEMNAGATAATPRIGGRGSRPFGASAARAIVIGALALSLAAGVSACGRKGPVEPPSQSSQ
ncbi:MAG: lipoprotein [Pseudomonadota bacterium]